MSERMKALWASGAFAHRRKPVRKDHWTPEQDDLLRAIVGTVPREQLHATWIERTGIERTLNALVVRCKRIDASMWARGWSMRDVEALFGVDHRCIEANWVATGELPAQRWHGRGANTGWWFAEQDIERFIRDYPWRYDWQRMRPGHRLAQVAEIVNRADPWRTYDELMAYIGLAKGNLDRWRRKGIVPHQWRPKGGGPRVMVRGRDFPAIQDAIRRAQADARERSRQKARMRAAGRQNRDARGLLLGRAA